MKTDILDRITAEEIEEWLLAKREAENLHSLSLNCLNYAHGPGIYWGIQTKVHCVHGKTLSEALAELLRREEKQPAETLIRERREQAARLLAEADELEGGAA